MKLEESISIYASSNITFEYLMNVENRKDYIPALEEIILLDPPPLGLGSRYIEVAEIAGRRLKTTYQITQFDPNKRVIAQTIDSIFPIEANLSLNDESSGINLSITLKFTLNGIFKLASGIVQGIVRKQAIDILNKIKDNVESLENAKG